MLCKKRFCLFQRPFGPVRLAMATIPFGSEAPDLFERAHITLGLAALDAPRVDSRLVLEQEHRRAEIENIVPSVHHLNWEMHDIVLVQYFAVLDPDCDLPAHGAECGCDRRRAAGKFHNAE